MWFPNLIHRKQVVQDYFKGRSTINAHLAHFHFFDERHREIRERLEDFHAFQFYRTNSG